MLVLAVVLSPATVMPLALRLSPFMVAVFEAVNWFDIVVFALEYVLKLYVAESRLAHFRAPWHLLDLGIVLLAGVEFLPFVEWPGAGAAPLLRLIRLVRFFAIAGRTGPDFLHATFHLKMEISRTLRNLWHLRSVLGSLRGRKGWLR